MKKAIVIGSPGAGKSTFSRKLRDITGFPLFYLDMIWHKPDKTGATQEEFDEKLRKILDKESWIIDGNYSRTLEIRLSECDTAFFLDYPLDICLAGIRSRIGTKREDLPWTEDELDPEFEQYVRDFPQTKLPGIYEAVEKYRHGREIIIFRSREEADNYIKNLSGEKYVINT